MVNVSRFSKILRSLVNLRVLMGIRSYSIEVIFLSNIQKVIKKTGKTTKINQKHFHQRLKLSEHIGTDDWRVTLNLKQKGAYKK